MSMGDVQDMVSSGTNPMKRFGRMPPTSAQQHVCRPCSSR
jgi:hypothetical protein